MRAVFLKSLILACFTAPSAAQACMPPLLETVKAATDLVVVGQYIHDPTDPARGTIVVTKSQHGRATTRIRVVWDLSVFNDPSTSQCAVTIPSDGSYEKFWLIRREKNSFAIIGRFGIEASSESKEGAAER